MKYDNTGIRRQDRLLDEDKALALLAKGEYGVLSMVAPEGTPYAIPVSFAWDGHDAIYIHCAPEGRKLRCLEACPKVSFCVVGGTEVLPRQFTTLYESIVVQGRASTGLEPEERMEALRMIVRKYAPEFAEVGEKYLKASFPRTEVIRLEIASVSGKAKAVRPKPQS